MTSKTTFTVHAILKGNASGYSLALFSEKEIAAPEILDHKGKPVLVCAVTGKARPAEPILVQTEGERGAGAALPIHSHPFQGDLG